MIRISKRNTIRIVSLFTACFLAAVGFAIKENNLKNYYIMLNRHNYSKNLEELSACLNNIEITVKKVLYSSSASEFGGLAAELWKESGVAKNALAELPYNQTELTVINRFLSQVGDYSLFLTKKLIVGNEITTEERDNILKLSTAASGIAGTVSESLTLFNDGYWTEELVSSIDENYISSFSESMKELEETLTDYPTLIYDGPFSDHMLTSSPKLTENAAEVDRDTARNTVLEVLKISPENLHEDTDENGTLPCYTFSTDNSETYITKRGGYIASFRKYVESINSKLSYDEAVKKAEEYIKNIGIEGEFKKTYYFADEGMCTVNFAYYENGITYYTDLIKIGVSLENGELLMVETTGYIFNHHEREKREPQNTEAAAKEKVMNSLEITDTRLALIPTSGREERLCYEFVCKGQSDHDVIVYINANTLEEEDILILLKTDGGILVK